MGGLEAAQELVQGVQDLFGQALADLVLVLAAVLQQGGEALRARHAQEPGLSEEQAHGGRDRPSRGREHVRDAKVEPAGAFAPRRGDEAQSGAVEEQPRRHAGVAQEAFHASVGRGFEAAVRPRAAARYVVEVLARLADANEKLPGGCTVCRGAFTFGAMHRRRFERSRRTVTCGAFPYCGFGPRSGRPSYRVCPDREVGSKDLTPFREHRFEVGRDWRFLRARVAAGEKFQPSTEDAKARKSDSRGSGSVAAPAASRPCLRSSTHPRSSCWPSASCRFRSAPALTSAGAETTSPVGRTKPIHSRWAAI